MPDQPDGLDRLKTALAARYRIERELGQGGMATIYLAEDLKHKRKVAVKVLRPELAAALGAERFLKEIEVTANLQHPNILPLYDSGEADRFLYYVMPYVEGESLREKLNREKQLGVGETVEIARDVAAALNFAHERNVIHRDIKPENVLIHSGQALVADFGIALALSHAGETRLTETGLSLGTPHYMSPEQAGGDRQLDRRSDVYSLGALVYEMLAGEPPHSGPTAQSILARIMTDRPQPLPELRDALSRATDAVVQRALATLPADRFATAAEFASELAASVRTTQGGRLAWYTPGRGSVLAAAVVALVLSMAWLAIPRGGSNSAGQIDRIAVLPLENLTGDSEQEYFAVGMTEAVITNLGQVGLNVLSRQSGARFASSAEPLPDVAQALNVDGIVVGSVFRSADRLRVDIRFVDGATEGQIWGHSFDTTLTAENVFDVQSGIAAAIARALKLEMTPETRERLAARPTNDVRALTAVQRGLFHWQEARSPADFALSKRYFEEAIGLDSLYADAWNGLAAVQSFLVGVGVSAEPQRDLREAKVAVQRALEIDSLNAGIGGYPASARGILAYINMYEWDFAAADREFRRAVDELGDLGAGPYPVYLAMIGRHDEAIRMFKERVELDPLSPFLRANLMALLWWAGEFERGLQELDRLPSEFRDVLAVGFLLRAGRVEDGLATLERLYRRPDLLSQGPLLTRGATGIALAIAAMTKAGRAKEARRHFEQFRLLFGPETRPAAQWAAAYLGLGEVDRALEVLRVALHHRDPDLAWIGQLPELDGLRVHPEFDAIADEIGVPNARRD